MTRGARFSVIALALLVVSGVAAAMPVGGVDTPLRVSFEALATPAGWMEGREAPETVLAPDGRAPIRLSRGYTKGPATEWVLVEYFPSQTESRRAAAREFVFPGAGWSQLTERAVTLPIASGGAAPIEANLVLVESGGQRHAVLYWYEVGGVATASDHGYRARLLYNRLVRGRSDGALIRIASPFQAGEDEQAILARHIDFLRVFYPALLGSLPR
ncbi:MAG TPA: EpsI family protein [Methylomirabilota bacterium]|nr:EpsI family protein [Methylomirabilota bacterium]